MRNRGTFPGYYRKNMVRNAQRKFLRRKKLEREAKRAAGRGTDEAKENGDQTGKEN